MPFYQWSLELDKTTEGVNTDECEIMNLRCLCSFFKHVEVDTCAETSQTTFWIDGVRRHDSCKSFAFGFPCKCNYIVFYLDDFDGNVLLSNMENFQIGKRGFLGFSVSVHLDAKELGL